MGVATLQVTQPRWPCFKLALYREQAHIGARLRETGRTGWYLRVLEPGEVPAAGPIHVVFQDPDGVSVLDAHLAMLRPRAAGSRPCPCRDRPSGARPPVAGAAAETPR